MKAKFMFKIGDEVKIPANLSGAFFLPGSIDNMTGKIKSRTAMSSNNHVYRITGYAFGLYEIELEFADDAVVRMAKKQMRKRKCN